MSYKRKLICLNCDIQGHAFRNCELPVRSYGIIAYKKSIGKDNEYLLIQRKDTIGKTDFLRGKYKTNGVINYNKLKCLIEEMTDEEKTEILTTPKETLWDNLWLDHNSGIFKNEKFKAMGMFNEIDYRTMLLEAYPSRYSQNEWGFPKGRKNLSEDGLGCAMREFIEETGLSKNDFVIPDITKTFTEEFTASDGVRYTHIYYIAKVRPNVDIKSTYKNTNFKQEVRDLDFFDYKSCYKMFRDYDTEKKHVLNLVHTQLS